MSRHVAIIAMLAGIALGRPAVAQSVLGDQHAPLASRFLDPSNGLTLDEAIQRALEHEPGLRAARADVEATRGMLIQAGLRPNPTVSLAQQTEPRGTDAQTRVEVQWPLDLFRRDGRVKVAEQEIETTQRATSDRERMLAADVRTRFGEVLSAIRELSVTDELVASVARQEALMAARADAGAIPPLERDLIRVELQRLQADRMLQGGHAEHALVDLRRLLGMAADAPLTLREDLEQLVRQEMTTLPAAGDAVSTRADVEEARARVSLADARLDDVRRRARVDMSLVGTYMRTDAGFPQRGFGPENRVERVRGVFHYLAGGVMLSLPVRDRKEGEIAAALAQRAGAEARLEAAQLTARAEVASARVRDEHARQALALYNTDVRSLARKNLDAVNQTYELGRMTLIEVLGETRRYLDTERAYTNVLREAYDSRQALETALGGIR